jgi:putrescine aminotransferase
MSQLIYWETSEQKKTITKTDGYWIQYKDEPEPCLDLTTGYGAFLLGYNNKEIKDRLYNMEVQFLRGNSGDTCDDLEELISLIRSRGNWESVAWAVSGSDGVEAAIFANDMYWKKMGGYRKKIISFFPGYHGATFINRHLRGDYPETGRATVLPSPQWHTEDQRDSVELVALQAVRRILENDTQKEYGCLIMETSPWSSDMCPWSTNWWKQIRSMCDEFGILFILDDVAVCWGKHGTWFGYEPFGVKPDLCVFGKALTGGYSPLSAVAVNKHVTDVLNTESFDYGHTWQPNLWGVAASLEVSKYIEKHNLLARVPLINQEIKNIAKEYGFITRGDYLFVIMETPRVITLGDLHNAGLSSGLPIAGATTGHIKFCMPLIADDEYFDVLRTRLKRLF